jgi:hypothetical protein
MAGCACQNASLLAALWARKLAGFDGDLIGEQRPTMESLNGQPCHHGHNCDVFLASYEKRCDRSGDLLNPSAMPPPSLDEVANLSLSVGKLFLETGASARTGARSKVAPARDRIEDIHCFLDNEELTRENSRNCEVSGLPKSSRCNGRRKVRIWCCKCVLRCSISAWGDLSVSGLPDKTA